MLPVPKKFFITAASCEGATKLNAFDNALLKARVGNVNLLRVSSILPPQAVHTPDLTIPPGSLVPIAYGSMVSDVPGDLIAAAVGIGFSADSFGVIMEFSGRCTKEEAEAEIDKMIKEAFAVRQVPLKDVMILGTEHRVENIGCVFAAVPLWY